MLQEEPNRALQELSFEELLAEKLFIETELNARADTELAAIRERLSLIAAYKGIELETLLAKKERKKREPRKAKEEEEVAEELPIAAQ